MHAESGDHIQVQGRRVGDPERSGEIIEVRGVDGTPPYVVRWENDPGEHLVYPGSDAVMTRFGKP